MSLREIERNWLLKRVNIADGQVSNKQLARTYFYNIGLTGTYREQVKKFLRKIITDNLQTPSDTGYTSTLLKEALVSLSVEPTVLFNENTKRLWLNYNP